MKRPYSVVQKNKYKHIKSFFSVVLFALLTACSSERVENVNCRFLLDVGVNVTIDLNLPQFGQLAFAGNSIYIPNEGNAGIIVASTGVDFFAWDAADPNHALSECSAIVPSGLNGVCGCGDENTYNFVTGTIAGNDGLRCALRNYRVQKNGNTLRVFN